MVVSVDFDGTCVTHEFPKTGKNIGAEIVLKALSEAGHRIICLTMRSEEHTHTAGMDTIAAVKKWFKGENIELYAVNDNPEQVNFSNSRKVYANIYIDDQFLGCPLNYNPRYSDRFFVDWCGVVAHLVVRDILSKKSGIKIIRELKEKYPDIYNTKNYYCQAFQDITKKEHKE